MAYAIIKTGGKQYKVATGDVIEVEKLALDLGTETQFAKATLFADDGAFSEGSVTAEVVAQVKAPKVIAFKYKRRKGYHRTVGHRRQLTKLKITSIAA
jgi:large subunit ribosomal protein L21